MDLEYFENFLSVLEHGSILAAAEATGASQPTLSRKIERKIAQTVTRISRLTTMGFGDLANGQIAYKTVRIALR